MNLATTIAECKAGNRHSQYKLYQQFADAMYNVCFRITANTDDATDAMQDGFINVFQHLDALQDIHLLPAWIKKIMVHQSLKLVKQRNKERQLFKSIAEEMPIPLTVADSPDELQPEQVQEAIQQLPDGYRAVLTLYLVEGYDHEEIAEILQISKSTSKSQYMRAKMKLKQILKIQTA
jgi:RNA polymerase sigma-70 factor (ECF subfamily)